jgi:hypothetical protein
MGPKADAQRLKTGRFLYRTILNGKDAGNSDISVRKLADSGNSQRSLLLAKAISGVQHLN